MASMSEVEAQECTSRAEAATQALHVYYQQPRASAYNIDEDLDALVTLTEWGQKAVHLEQQHRHYSELSGKPLVALYTDIPDHLVPPEFKNQKSHSLIETSLTGAYQSPPQRAFKDKQEAQETLIKIRAEGPIIQEGNPQFSKIQEILQLLNLSISLIHFFNNLNNSQYTNGTVNLSKIKLSEPQRSNYEL